MFAVDQIILVKGLGYGYVELILKEKTRVLSPSHQASLYFLYTSCKHVSFLLPATACVTPMNNRSSQETLLAAFLLTTAGGSSYPPRSKQITIDAHGVILKQHLARHSEEFIHDLFKGE